MGSVAADPASNGTPKAKSSRQPPRPAVSRHADWALAALAVTALVAATWLYMGYRYNSWPQPGFLASVLALSGELEGDWYTSFPPGRWALDHALAVLPNSLLEPALLVGWLVGLAILWGSFLSICRSLGASLAAGTAAGLVVIPTGIGGFGLSEALFNLFYPNGPSTALVVASLALLLRDRPAPAGAALGLAVLIHPGVGLLGVLALAPVAVYLLARRRSEAWRFALPLAILALPAVIQLMDQIAGGTLSAREQYEFLAIVRTPHHYLYSFFSADEYWRAALWTLVLIGSLAFLRRGRSARALGIVLATCVLLCAAGAVAGEIGGPVALVTAQTSRLSGVIVLLAIAASAGALTRLAGSAWATIVLLNAFLLAPLLHHQVGYVFDPGPFATSKVNAAEGMLVLGAMAFTFAFVWLRPRLRAPARDGSPQASALLPAIAAVLSVVAVASLVIEHGDRAVGVSPQDRALQEVGEMARDRTDSGELVLGSPNMNGLRVYAQRPNVVEYGSIRLGEGDREWRHRILDLTEAPEVLAPDSFGTDILARGERIDTAYEEAIQRSPTAVCKYEARMVVTPPLRSSPGWLRPVFRNEHYELFAVRPGTCQGSRVG